MLGHLEQIDSLSNSLFITQMKLLIKLLLKLNKINQKYVDNAKGINKSEVHKKTFVWRHEICNIITILDVHVQNGHHYY